MSEQAETFAANYAILKEVAETLRTQKGTRYRCADSDGRPGARRLQGLQGSADGREDGVRGAAAGGLAGVSEAMLDSATTRPTADMLERYKTLRAAGKELNMGLVKEVPRFALAECGKKLGLYRQGTLVFGSEDEVPVLYDYAFYHFRRGGKNVIERYWMLSPPAAGTTERELGQAMLNAYYSVFMTTAVHQGLGVDLFDVLRETTITVMDLSMSATMRPGQYIAGHMLPLADLRMFSGAAIPLAEAVFENRVAPMASRFMANAKRGSGRLFSPSQEAAFSAQVIRAALQAGAMDRMAYTDMES